MRLNLGEIAMCLGCGPDGILWEKGLPGDDAARSGARRRLAESLPTGAQMDSRQVRPGDLFFCLPGEHTDGHNFALEAARAGASAIVALRNPFAGREEEAAGAGVTLPPVFLVEDVQRGLGRVAACHRDTAIARVVGVTGSAGKTSVKETLAQVLAMRGLCERNPLNLNNQIGLPLSMLNAAADASFWVMEAGISQPGDMEELGDILRPDLALILNVGEAHLAGLGDKGVAAHKAALLDYIQPGGLAVVSADYPELNAEVDKRAAALEHGGIRVIRFSMQSPDCPCRARYIGPGHALTGRFEVHLHGERFELDAPFRGEFGGENVAAVCAAASALSLDREEMSRGLAGAALPEQRFHGERIGRFVVIDDSYNANPLSMRRMIEAARTVAGEQEWPLILVLGEMLELGERAAAAHEEMARLAVEAAPVCFFWKGEHREAVRRGLREGGYSGEFYPVGGGQEFSQLLEELKLTRGVVLFKGSRGNHLERLAAVFRDSLASSGERHAV
jgi:UDP-N-acetylmuramoyl-tripeptide--D-alanyl-D-alanine ligase